MNTNIGSIITSTPGIVVTTVEEEGRQGLSGLEQRMTLLLSVPICFGGGNAAFN